MFQAMQHGIILIASLAAFIGAAWALIHATKTSPQAFVNVGKSTKNVWVAILGVAGVISFISLPWPLGTGGGIFGLLGIASLAAVIIYHVDVKPRVSEFGGGSRGPRGGASRGGW